MGCGAGGVAESVSSALGGAIGCSCEVREEAPVLGMLARAAGARVEASSLAEGTF